MAELYRALESFAFVDDNGVPWPITPGTIVSKSDPAYKGRAHLFEPVEAAVHQSSKASHAVETASAAPGERRFRSKADEKAYREDEHTPPQGKKNFDPPPQAVDGPEPEPPGPPVGAGAVNFDPKPQQVDGPENTEPEPTGEKDDTPPPQKVDGGPKRTRGSK